MGGRLGRVQAPDRPGEGLMQKVATLVPRPAPPKPDNKVRMADCQQLLKQRDAAHAAEMRAKNKAHAAELLAKNEAHALERARDQRLNRFQTTAILALASTIVSLLLRLRFS